jgi:hypothetical protein
MLLNSASTVSNTSDVAKYTGVCLSALGIFLLILSIYSLRKPISKFSESHFFSNSFLILEFVIFLAMITFFSFVVVLKSKQSAYKKNDYSLIKEQTTISESRFLSLNNTIKEQQANINNLKKEITNMISSQDLVMNTYNEQPKNEINLLNTIKGNFDQKSYIEGIKDYLTVTENSFHSLIEFAIEISSKISSLNINNSASLSSAVIKTNSMLNNIQFLNNRVLQLNEIIARFGLSKLSVADLVVKIIDESYLSISSSSERDLLKETILNRVSKNTSSENLKELIFSLKDIIQTRLNWTTEKFDNLYKIFENCTNPDAISQLSDQLKRITQIIHYPGTSASDFQNYFSNSTITTSKAQFLQLVNLCAKYGIEEDTYKFLTEDLPSIAATINSHGDLSSDLQNLFSINQLNRANLQSIVNICFNIDPNTNFTNVKSIFTNWINCFANYSPDKISSQLFPPVPDNFISLLYNQIDSTIYNTLTSVDNFSQLPLAYSTLNDIQNLSTSLGNQFSLFPGNINNSNNLRNIDSTSSNSMFPAFISMWQQNLGGYNFQTPFLPSNALVYINQFTSAIRNTFSTTVASFLSNPSYYINKCQYPFNKINSSMISLGFDYPNTIEQNISFLESITSPFVSVSRNSLNLSNLSRNLLAKNIIQQVRDKVNTSSEIFKDSLLSNYLDSNKILPYDIQTIKWTLRDIFQSEGSAPEGYLNVVQSQLNNMFGSTSLSIRDQLDIIYQTLTSCNFSGEDPRSFIRSLNYFSDFQKLLAPYTLKDSLGLVAQPFSTTDLSVLSNIDLISPSLPSLQSLKNSMIAQFDSWYMKKYNAPSNLTEEQFFLVVKNILSYRCFIKILKELLYQASLGKFFTFYTNDPRMSLTYSAYRNLDITYLQNLISNINLSSINIIEFNFTSVAEQTILLMDIYREFGRLYTLGKYLDSGIQSSSLENIVKTFVLNTEGILEDKGNTLELIRKYNGRYISANEINNMSSSTILKTSISFPKTLNVLHLPTSSSTISYQYHIPMDNFTEFMFFNCPISSLNETIPLNRYFLESKEQLGNLLSLMLIDETS